MFTTTMPRVDVRDAIHMATNGDMIIDVRESFEYAGGHVPDARLIPLQQLPQHVSDLPKDRRVLLICASGNRSMHATQYLRQAGIDAHNVDGGMIAWQQAGLPITR